MKKPREWWLVERNGEIFDGGVCCSRAEALDCVAEWHEVGFVGFRIINVREVIEEEGGKQ